MLGAMYSSRSHVYRTHWSALSGACSHTGACSGWRVFPEAFNVTKRSELETLRCKQTREKDADDGEMLPTKFNALIRPSTMRPVNRSPTTISTFALVRFHGAAEELTLRQALTVPWSQS